MVLSFAEPSDLIEIYSRLGIKGDSLGFQTLTLLETRVPSRSETDLSLVINDPVPRHIGPRGKRGHRIPDDAGRTSADNAGDLTVGGYPARRYLINNGIYPPVQRDM